MGQWKSLTGGLQEWLPPECQSRRAMGTRRRRGGRGRQRLSEEEGRRELFVNRSQILLTRLHVTCLYRPGRLTSCSCLSLPPLYPSLYTSDCVVFSRWLCPPTPHLFYPYSCSQREGEGERVVDVSGNSARGRQCVHGVR